MSPRLSSDQQELARAMSEISESCYSAGWMYGLEFALWYLLVSGKQKYGRYRLSDAQRARLSELCSRCAGWITFEISEGEVFVAINDWKQKFVAESPKYISEDEKSA